MGIPYEMETDGYLDCAVVSRGYRSIGAVEYPFPINTLPMSAIMALPGIGKKRAARIVKGRPYDTFGELEEALDDPKVAGRLLDIVTLD